MSFMAYTANTEKQLGFGEYFFKSEENDWQGRENKYYTLERVRDILFFFPQFYRREMPDENYFPRITQGDPATFSIEWLLLKGWSVFVPKDLL